LRPAHRAIVASVGVALAACGGEELSPAPEPAPSCSAIETAPGALAKKAADFDRLAQELHIPKGQDQIHTVTLAADLTTRASVKVADNQGLWTSLYATSQAYRWAVTKSDEALDNTRRAVRASVDLLRITGVEGLFARASVNPKLAGYPSERELYAQYPDCDLAVKHCKRWIKVESGPYAGLLFKNDVSKDEYSGHIHAMGVIAKLVDDAEILGWAREIAGATAHHLIDNGLQFKDVDGAVTTFGDMRADAATDDLPGFNAVLVLGWLKVAAALTGEQAIVDFYDHCLVQRDRTQCQTPGILSDTPYPEELPTVGLNLGCLTNFSNHNMAQLSMFALLQHETDPDLRATYQTALTEAMWSADDAFPMRAQANSLFTFFFEVSRNPSTPRPDKELDEAICTLARYPAEKHIRATDTLHYGKFCTDRTDHDMSLALVPIDERRADNYQWTKNPYRIEKVDEDRQRVESPEDYLLAYWMGRYHGLVGEEL
jgi:hypothetical protein